MKTKYEIEDMFLHPISDKCVETFAKVEEINSLEFPIMQVLKLISDSEWRYSLHNKSEIKSKDVHYEIYNAVERLCNAYKDLLEENESLKRELANEQYEYDCLYQTLEDIKYYDSVEAEIRNNYLDNEGMFIDDGYCIPDEVYEN